MSNQPLFSVLIANYNNGKYLMNAIDSVRKQTYPNWEIIIVDDGSTDNSYEIYKKLKTDNRIYIYYNKINKGIAYTKKRTIDESHGELLAFLDPDDELTSNALYDHTLVHIKHKTVSIIYSRHYLCDREMNIVSESRILTLNSDESYFTHKDYRAEHLVSIKKALYYKTDGINLIYKLAVDTNVNFLLEEVGSVCCLNKVCYKYRYNLKTQATSDYARHMFWNLLVQYDTCKRRNIDVEKHVYNWFQDSVEFLAKKKIYETEINIRNSATYKLGYILLMPIKWLKSLIK
ncbi:MAG: glycosyltransferase family 2 protein [Paludibacteraceae bacterium]|nr:glycosyltransferase family 2 protein [Paludibacteraceae bacterium]